MRNLFLKLEKDLPSTEPLPNSDKGEHKKEYVAGLRAWADEDKKVVLLWITFDLASVALILTGKVFIVGSSPLVAIGVVLLVFSAILYFAYYHDLHMTTRELNKYYLSLKCDDALNTVRSAWWKNSRIFKLGTICLILGILALTFKYAYGVNWHVWP